MPKARAELDLARAELAFAEAKLRLAETQFQQLGAAEPEARQKSTLSRQKQERLRQLLADEIQVAEGQAKLAREQHQAGATALETSQMADLEVLALKHELASLEGEAAKAQDLTRQQLRILQELERDIHKRREGGLATEADELRVRRQILLLQRQQAELE